MARVIVGYQDPVIATVSQYESVAKEKAAELRKGNPSVIVKVHPRTVRVGEARLQVWCIVVELPRLEEV